MSVSPYPFVDDYGRFEFSLNLVHRRREDSNEFITSHYNFNHDMYSTLDCVEPVTNAIFQLIQTKEIKEAPNSNIPARLKQLASDLDTIYQNTMAAVSSRPPVFDQVEWYFEEARGYKKVSLVARAKSILKLAEKASMYLDAFSEQSEEKTFMRGHN